MELFNSAHNQALKLADDTHKMADAMGGANGARLREQSGHVADNARVLRTAMEVGFTDKLRRQQFLITQQILDSFIFFLIQKSSTTAYRPVDARSTVPVDTPRVHGKPRGVSSATPRGDCLSSRRRDRVPHSRGQATSTEGAHSDARADAAESLARDPGHFQRRNCRSTRYFRMKFILEVCVFRAS